LRYDSEEVRNYNRRRGIKSNIPVNERRRRNKKRGRPRKFKQLDYKFRKSVEKAFAWLPSLGSDFLIFNTPIIAITS
jgi:hypothetical protein